MTITIINLNTLEQQNYYRISKMLIRGIDKKEIVLIRKASDSFEVDEEVIDFDPNRKAIEVIE